MTVIDNRPPLADLLDRLSGVPASVMEQFGPPAYGPLQQMLDRAIADVEDQAGTFFNATSVFEERDGNGTNRMVLRKRPAISVQRIAVETPILGYTRVYEPDEIKLYAREGVVMVFTYKLAVEQALISHVDYQAWGSLFPPLPRAVKITYVAGYPAYDPELDQTSLDAGATWVAGDQRDPTLKDTLATLRDAAVSKAGAAFLGKAAPLAVGLTQSVSFDGYSRSFNPAAFSAQAQAWSEHADSLMKRRKRMIMSSTLGA